VEPNEAPAACRYDFQVRGKRKWEGKDVKEGIEEIVSLL